MVRSDAMSRSGNLLGVTKMKNMKKEKMMMMMMIMMMMTTMMIAEHSLVSFVVHQPTTRRV